MISQVPIRPTARSMPWGRPIRAQHVGRKSLCSRPPRCAFPKGVDDAWTLAEFEDALAKLQAPPGIKYALDVKLNYGQGEWFTYGFSPQVQSMERRPDRPSRPGRRRAP